MKFNRIVQILFLVIMLTVFFAFSTSAQTTSNNIYFIANAENENTKIYTQTAPDGKMYLFLPSSADLSNLTLCTDSTYESVVISADQTIEISFGETFNVLSLFDNIQSENGEYAIKISASTESEPVFEQEIIIMKSENLRSLYLASEDPENKGRKWVDSSKSNEAKGEMVLLGTDGEIDHADKLTELKARGNSTFTDFEKKAYQIKTDKKAALVGDEDNKIKKWVLLANAGDVTLIHNSLVVTLAKDLGLPYTIDCEPIDLYYDGEYRGSYLITDKVEVGETGVDIQDLDGMIEDLNENTDAYENPVVVTKTIASKGETSAKTDSAGSYKYVQGLIEPELENGTTHHGYLLEIDFIYRYTNEQTGFVTNRGQAVVTKNPEYLTKETGAFISQFFQDFENAVFSPDGYNKETGKYYYEYCDLDSLVKIYLINEFTKNYDSFRSSAYFYLPEDEDIMYAGPIWDYDLCFTTGYDFNSQESGNYENFWAATKYMLNTLITIESFRDAVKTALNSENGEFYLAAKNMLGEDGNIAKYATTVYASQRMNFKLWDITHDETAAFRCGDEETYENGVDFMYDFATARLQWLSDITSTWEGDNYSAPMDPTKWSSNSRYHELKIIEAKDATCTEPGRTEGSECASCGKVFTKSNTIPAKGHSWTNATCTEKATCTVCGETKSELGHNWKNATCTKPKTCAVCGITEGTALSHNYQKNPDDKRNSDTCIVYACTFCKKTLLVSVQPQPKYELGDINMDGVVTASDARIALRISAEIEESNDTILMLGDMNSDKQLTASDARLILRKSAELSD